MPIWPIEPILPNMPNMPIMPNKPIMPILHNLPHAIGVPLLCCKVNANEVNTLQLCLSKSIAFKEKR